MRPTAWLHKKFFSLTSGVSLRKSPAHHQVSVDFLSNDVDCVIPFFCLYALRLARIHLFFNCPITPMRGGLTWTEPPTQPPYALAPARSADSTQVPRPSTRASEFNSAPTEHPSSSLTSVTTRAHPPGALDAFYIIVQHCRCHHHIT